MALGFTRREAVSTASAAAALMPASCSAKPMSAQFTPEEFGAIGNGIADDYEAFQRMAAAVNRMTGATVVLKPGATYFLDRYITPGNGITDVTFQGCSGLLVQGNSASISVKGNIFRDVITTRGLAGLRFEDCNDVQVRNLQLIGNVQLMTRRASVTEAPTHGLLFGGCLNVVVDGVVARHFATDGLYIRASSRPDLLGRYRASRNFEVRNSRFMFNARQGLSVIQLRGGIFETCEFSHTGYVEAPAVQGSYGLHAPGAGVDIEPNATPTVGRTVDVLTGNLAFRGCRMSGNAGKSFVAAAYVNGSPASEIVTLDHCLLEADQASTSRYGLIFDVPGGTITDSTLSMGNKTAFIGWTAASDASPRLKGNLITGYCGGSNRPYFFLMKGAGAPLLEQNRFIGDRHVPQPGAAKAPQLVTLSNPRAVVRDNEFFLPREAYPSGSSGLAPAVVADVRNMEGNRYETDLAGGNGRSFGILYGEGCAASNESFHGTSPGLHDTVEPARLNGRSPIVHDSRLAWSRQ
jgi:hypothetical protein